MRTHYPILLPMFLLVLVPTIRAQAPPDSGSRVRIAGPQLENGKFVGTLQRITPDTVVINGQSFSRAGIERLEVSAGSGSRWLAGMVIGLAGGTGLGSMVGVMSCGSAHPNSDDNVARALCVLLFSGIGGGGGMVIGGILGSTKEREHWRRAPLGPVRIEPIIRRNGSFGLSLGLSF